MTGIWWVDLVGWLFAATSGLVGVRRWNGRRATRRTLWLAWCAEHGWCPVHDMADGGCPPRRVLAGPGEFGLAPCKGSGLIRVQQPNGSSLGAPDAVSDVARLFLPARIVGGVGHASRAVDRDPDGIDRRQGRPKGSALLEAELRRHAARLARDAARASGVPRGVYKRGER